MHDLVLNLVVSNRITPWVVGGLLEPLNLSILGRKRSVLCTSRFLLEIPEALVGH